LAVASLFARVVAAYSCGDNALIAFSGRYRSPVSLDGLPLLVRHFCSPHLFNDFCGAFMMCTRHLSPCIVLRVVAPCEQTTVLLLYHVLRDSGSTCTTSYALLAWYSFLLH
jgi:hypothetical protein